MEHMRLELTLSGCASRLDRLGHLECPLCRIPGCRRVPSSRSSRCLTSWRSVLVPTRTTVAAIFAAVKSYRFRARALAAFRTPRVCLARAFLPAFTRFGSFLAIESPLTRFPPDGSFWITPRLLASPSTSERLTSRILHEVRTAPPPASGLSAFLLTLRPTSGS